MKEKSIFTSLVGSHNYNLNTKESDKDYKRFLIPNFNDLYSKDLIKSESFLKLLKEKNGEELDIEYHDIRKIESLFYKANINFLEVLFSEDMEVNSYYEEEMSELLNLRQEIAKMNLPYLYKACIGMYHNKRKLLTKGTEGTQYVVKKYGYDTKQAMHCYRVLDFLKRFQKTNFNDFKDAIWYKDDDRIRECLLRIKDGKLTLEEVEAMLDRKLAVTTIFCEETYGAQEFDPVTNQKLISIIKKIVKKGLKREFDCTRNCNYCIYSYLDDGPQGSYSVLCGNNFSKYKQQSVGTNNICRLFIED